MFSHLRHLCAIFWVTGAAAQSFDVSSLSWWLKSSNGSIQVPASVPSQVHLDLLKAGIITEPLLGINGTFCSKSYMRLKCLMVNEKRFYATVDRR